MLIEVKNLTRKFKNLIAVNNLSLNIKEGEIFGILGPNGAGKTTLISMLTTALNPTEGNIKILNLDPIKDGKEIRAKIGVVFQDFLLDEELSTFDNLDIHSRLYIENKKERLERIQEVLKIVSLENEQKRKVKEFSGGMKRRLEIARGILSNPKILFLDEPTLGLDPIAKNDIWKYIKKINNNNKTSILLTTNNMHEAEALCSRIAIINKGKIIKLETVKKLKLLFKNKKTLEDIFIHLIGETENE